MVEFASLLKVTACFEETFHIGQEQRGGIVKKKRGETSTKSRLRLKGLLIRKQPVVAANIRQKKRSTSPECVENGHRGGFESQDRAKVARGGATREQGGEKRERPPAGKKRGTIKGATLAKGEANSRSGFHRQHRRDDTDRRGYRRR